MARKTYNPSNKNKTKEIVNFRGIIVDKNEQMTLKGFVGDCSNLVSFRTREMTNRVGQARKSGYDQEITAGKHTLNYVTVCAGTNAYLSTIEGTGAESTLTDYGNLTPNKEIDFMRPITGTNFTEVTANLEAGQRFSNDHGSVFSRKRAVWDGVDQGKGKMYRGDSVEMALNLRNGDNVLKIRDGSDRAGSGDDPIRAGKGTESGVTIVIGTNAYFGEEFDDIAI